MRKQTIIALFLALGLLSAAGCFRQSIRPGEVNKLKIRQLAEKPELYADLQVLVKGQLENAGANYFTDMRLMLSDGKGNRIRVMPWLPVSVPPPRPGGPRIRPALQSDFLERQVSLTGRWLKQEEGYAIQVEKAEQED